MEIGKSYVVNHSRKGTFAGILREIDDDWATLRVIGGRAKAALSYNEKFIGDMITVRRSFCKFTEQPNTN